MRTTRLLIAVVVVLALVAILSGCGGHYVEVTEDWAIIDKIYTPATSGTHGRWATTFSDGGMGLTWVQGNRGSDAMYEFVLVRDTDEGEREVWTEDVSQVDYYSYDVGDTYTLTRAIWQADEEDNHD